MANGYVQLAADSTGKKVQQFQNTIGSNVVEAMAITYQNPSSWINSYVQVAADSTGKKIQYFQNTISGNVVLAQAVTLVNTSGVAI